MIPALQCTSCRQPSASFLGLQPRYSCILAFHSLGMSSMLISPFKSCCSISYLHVQMLSMFLLDHICMYKCCGCVCWLISACMNAVDVSSRSCLHVRMLWMYLLAHTCTYECCGCIYLHVHMLSMYLLAHTRVRKCCRYIYWLLSACTNAVDVSLGQFVGILRW